MNEVLVQTSPEVCMAKQPHLSIHAGAVFGKSFTLIPTTYSPLNSNQGVSMGDYAHQLTTTPTPGFSDIPTALTWYL